MKRRKLKPETRVQYQRYTIKALRGMLEWASSSFTAIANAADEGRTLEPKSLREAASECARMARIP